MICPPGSLNCSCNIPRHTCLPPPPHPLPNTYACPPVCVYIARESQLPLLFLEHPRTEIPALKLTGLALYYKTSSKRASVPQGTTARRESGGDWNISFPSATKKNTPSRPDPPETAPHSTPPPTRHPARYDRSKLGMCLKKKHTQKYIYMTHITSFDFFC